MACLMMWVWPAAQAHHSVTSQYDTSRFITLEGTVLILQLGSPHSVLVIVTARPHSQSVSWTAELASAIFLRRAGWTSRSLTLGEPVRLTGAPSRNNPTALYATSVIKGDGTHLLLVPLTGPASTGPSRGSR